MPTGAGKSLTYQIPARLLGGTTLVVSPLIALMKDQVDSVTEVGLRATYLNSSLELEERRRRVAGLRRRRLRAVLRGAGGHRGVGRQRARAHGPAPHRRRRGPLHQPVGPRLPSRVPQPGRAQAPLRRRAGAGADRDGDARGHQRHRRAAGDGQAARLPRQLLPPQPDDLDLPQGRRARRRGGRGAARARGASCAWCARAPGQSGIVYCLSRKSVEATAEFLARPGRARGRLPRRHGARRSATARRRRSGATTPTWWSPPSRSAWASTSPTSAT